MYILRIRLCIDKPFDTIDSLILTLGQAWRGEIIMPTVCERQKATMKLEPDSNRRSLDSRDTLQSDALTTELPSLHCVSCSLAGR